MIETSIIALVPGTFEGLLAVAMVLVYSSRGVINLSLAATGALGAYLAAVLAPHVGLLPALALGLILTVFSSVGISTGVSWKRTSIWNPLPLLVTLLVAVVLEQGLTRIWNTGLEFPDLLPQRVVSIGRYQVTPLHVTGVVAGVLAIILAIWAMRTLSRGAPVPGNVSVGDWEWWSGSIGILSLAGILAFAAAALTAEAGFGPGYMVGPAVVASLAAATALFRRPEIAFLSAVAIEVARNLSVRFNVPHAGYTSGVAVVLLVAAVLYTSRYLVIWRMRPS